MNLARLHEDLKFDEGVIYEIYLDHLGLKTFGIGHLVTEADPEWSQPPGTIVHYQRVHDCFAQDVQRAEKLCKKLYATFWDGFPEEVQEILVNMIFNLGYTGLSNFKKMNLALCSGDWAGAAKHGRDSKWYMQVSNRAERLMKRLENIV